jgi:hypothetical protein
MLQQVGGKAGHVEPGNEQAENEQKADQNPSQPGPTVRSGRTEALASSSGIVIIRHGVPRRVLIWFSELPLVPPTGLYREEAHRCSARWKVSAVQRQSPM